MSIVKLFTVPFVLMSAAFICVAAIFPPPAIVQVTFYRIMLGLAAVQLVFFWCAWTVETSERAKKGDR